MKRFLILLIFTGAMILVSCSSHPMGLEKAKSPETLFSQYAHQLYADKEWQSFSIEKREVFRGEALPSLYFHVCYCYDNNNPIVYFNQHESLIYYKITKDTITKIDCQNMEFSTFVNDDEASLPLYSSIKANVEYKIGYIPYYYQSCLPGLASYGKVSIDKVSETIISYEKQSLVFEGYDEIQVFENCDTGEKNELQYRCLFWVDKTTAELDSLIMIKTNDKPYSDTIIYIIKDKDDNRQNEYFDQVFDNKREYEKYSIHNDNDIPFSMIGSDIDTITNELLHYPLVNLQNDTSFLSDYDTWVLLNYWCFNCPTCIKELEEWGKEKDSLGYRPLTINGIKIISINYKSDNIELLKQLSSKTKSEDILFHSKGIGQFINIPYLGYNYLLSPDKKIVYKSPYIGHKGDYSELLQAKADYEKQHQNR